MTVLDEVKKRVAEMKENVAARQRGEKPEIKMPVLNAIRSNMEIRIREHRVILARKREETPAPPPLPPQKSATTPYTQETSTSTSSMPATETRVSKEEREKIYI